METGLLRGGDIQSTSMCVGAGRVCTMPKAFPKELGGTQSGSSGTRIPLLPRSRRMCGDDEGVCRARTASGGP
jgi:hypothetical protein